MQLHEVLPGNSGRARGLCLCNCWESVGALTLSIARLTEGSDLVGLPTAPFMLTDSEHLVRVCGSPLLVLPNCIA